jgi:maltooligosyltrehalose trehalohydrolase
MKRSHSMPFGAELQEDGSTRFRLWAPKALRVNLCLESPKQEHIAFAQLDSGWFELTTHAAPAGSLYRFQIDSGMQVPDPARAFSHQMFMGQARSSTRAHSIGMTIAGAGGHGKKQ